MTSPRAQNRARYTCGLLVQWLVASELDPEDSDAVWSFWQTLWPATVRRDTDLIEDFVQVAGNSSPRTFEQVKSMLESEGTTRWFSIIESISNHTTITRAEPSPLMTQVMIGRSLALSRCGEFWGAGSIADGRVYLSVPSECDLFSDNKLIETIDGFDLISASSATLEHLVAACKNGIDIEVSLVSDGSIMKGNFPCTVPIELPPPSITIGH